jgi:hypothetical protein
MEDASSILGGFWTKEREELFTAMYGLWEIFL